MNNIQKRFIGYSCLSLFLLLASTFLVFLDFKIPYLALFNDISQLMCYVSIVCAFCFVVYFGFSKGNGKYLLMSIVLLFVFTTYEPLINKFIFLENAKTYPNEKISLKVASSNVYYETKDLNRILAWVEKNNPDVMSFIEVSDFQTNQITEKLKANYPYIYLSKTQQAFGIAVYSKYVLNNAKFYYDSGFDEPFFNGVLTLNGFNVNIGVAHPMLPMPHNELLKRDNRIMELASIQVNARASGSIIMGDFNAARSSTLFRDLRKSGFDYKIAPTSSFFSVEPFLILIDHILVRGDLRVVDSGHKRVGVTDHHIVWADLN